MRAAVCREVGPPDQLPIVEVDPPSPSPGQVVIDVRAAGVNFVDGLFVQGKYQIQPPLPFTPGGEVAGVVTQLGEGVDSHSIGDRVVAQTWLGGYAEQVAVAAASALPLGDAVTFGQGAAFVQSYCTGLFALEARAGLRAGETLLVLGSGGGVGRAAVDVGKALGARVIAAASSPTKLALAREAGADEVIDYSHEDLKARARELSEGDGVDVVYDPVGGRLAEPALRAMRDDGRFLVIGFASGDIPAVPLNLVLLRNRRVVGVDWGRFTMQDLAGQLELLRRGLEMAAEGRLHPPEPAARPLDEAGQVLTELLGGQVTGKVVLVP